VHRSRFAPGAIPFVAVSIAWSAGSAAQTPAAPGGAPPADLASTVAGPKGPGDAPGANKLDVDFLHAAVSAGGQFQTGNSKIYAGTATGMFELRRGADDFGASLIGNYAETYVAPTPPTTTTGEWKRSTENFQGKARYERYLLPNLSGFVQVTGTHDRFIAATFRLNVDPGARLLILTNPATQLWAEAGYDFQFDDNFTDSNGLEQAGAGGTVDNSSGIPYLIEKTDTMHSSRVFVGFHQAFSKDVQLGLGLEYLQGFGGTGSGPPPFPPGFTSATASPQSIVLTASRVNFDALFAANVGAGFSLGLGFTAKYNSQPLPGKGDLDTMGTVQLIYTLSSPAPTPPPPPPCAPPPPASGSTATPAGAPAPASAPGSASAPAPAATPAPASAPASAPATTSAPSGAPPGAAPAQPSQAPTPTAPPPPPPAGTPTP